MIDGLTRLVQYFTLSQDEKIDVRLRKRELKKVRQYCLEQGLEFYPEEVLRLPSVAREVNDFIQNRAERDLPQEQFQGRLSPRDLSKWVEIGGVLGYNGHLFEMNYAEPDPRNVELQVRLPTGATVSQKIWTELYRSNPDDARTISSSVSMKVVSREDLDRARYVFDWHTHHVGWGEMSEGDAQHMNCILERFSQEKPIYFVVFRPEKNQAVWYQAKKAQP